MKTLGIATTAVSLLAACAVGGLVSAQENNPPQPPPPPPVIAVLDANRDCVIDAAEIAGAPAALLRLDVNQDGALTPQELRPAAPNGERRGPGNGQGRGEGMGPGRPGGPGMPIIAALDANKDGTISAGEIANASAALLSLDKNGDGQLTQDEFCAGPPPSREERGGPGRGPNGPGNGQGRGQAR